MRRFYGQRVAPTAPEFDAWLQLYAALYADRTQTDKVHGTAGVRAWRGLLAGMLRSPRIVLY